MRPSQGGHIFAFCYAKHHAADNGQGHCGTFGNLQFRGLRVCCRFRFKVSSPFKQTDQLWLHYKHIRLQTHIVDVPDLTEGLRGNADLASAAILHLLKLTKGMQNDAKKKKVLLYQKWAEKWANPQTHGQIQLNNTHHASYLAAFSSTVAEATSRREEKHQKKHAELSQSRVRAPLQQGFNTPHLGNLTQENTHGTNRITKPIDDAGHTSSLSLFPCVYTSHT